MPHTYLGVPVGDVLLESLLPEDDLRGGAVVPGGVVGPSLLGHHLVALGEAAALKNSLFFVSN